MRLLPLEASDRKRSVPWEAGGWGWGGGRLISPEKRMDCKNKRGGKVNFSL